MNMQSGLTVLLAFVLIGVLVNYVYFQNETRKLFAETQSVEKQKMENFSS